MYVYFIHAKDSLGGNIKIGIANDVEQRLAQLQTGCPHQLFLLGTIKARSQMHARALERTLHDAFEHFHQYGEWFRNGAELRQFIVDTCVHGRDPEESLGTVGNPVGRTIRNSPVGFVPRAALVHERRKRQEIEEENRQLRVQLTQFQRQRTN